MAIELEHDEKIIKEFKCQPSKKIDPFAISISNKAIYLLRKKLVSIGEPFYFEKIPLLHIHIVRRRKIKPLFLWILSLILILAGVFFFIYVTLPLIKGEVSGRIDIATMSPISIFVGGLLLPFAARNRYGLFISYNEKKFKWKPPLVFGKKARNEIKQMQDEILDICKSVNVKIDDHLKKTYLKEIITEVGIHDS